MHFFKSAALAFALGLALIDARAIYGNRGASSNLKVRGTDSVQGHKNLPTRGLFGSDSDVDEDISKHNAEACAKALNKLRKSKLRKSKARKRADSDDAMDLDDLSSDSNMGFGEDSFTVAQGTSNSVVFANEDDIKKFGTVGLNSCTGVLIVGNKGAIAAHINPIEVDGNRDDFTQEVADMTALFNDKKDELELTGATMYIVTPTHNGERKGEKEVLESTAGQLGLSVDSTEYEPVADDAFDEDYTDSGKGSIEVSWEDEGDDVKVRVFDQDK